MQKLSLDALARELVGQAAGGEKPGDSHVSRTVVGGHEKALRQTVIALAKDAALAEHASPGEATVFVLRGRVSLAAGPESWEGREGDLIIVPDAPHSLTALADSAVLLTVVKHSLSTRAAWITGSAQTALSSRPIGYRERSDRSLVPPHHGAVS